MSWRARDRAAELSGSARAGGRSLLALLERLVPLARSLLAAVRVFAAAAAISVAVIVAVILAHGVPRSSGIVLVLLLVLLLAPWPIALGLFARALREALDLPAWLQRSPDLARTHGAELAGLVAQARRTEGPHSRRPLRDSGRAARLLLEAHGDLPDYGSALTLLSVPFLAFVAVSAVLAGFEIVLAVSVVVVDIALRIAG